MNIRPHAPNSSAPYEEDCLRQGGVDLRVVFVAWWRATV
jgi:hypothetical protein